MNPITIDGEQCIVCSKCINDCPNSYLFLENDEIQQTRKDAWNVAIAMQYVLKVP